MVGSRARAEPQGLPFQLEGEEEREKLTTGEYMVIRGDARIPGHTQDRDLISSVGRDALCSK